MHNPPPDVQAELARERNRIAADRTLLSFIRNSLTLISIGVGVDRVVRALSLSGPNIQTVTHNLTLILISLGFVSLLLAIYDYQQELKRLEANDYHFTPRWSIAGITSIMLLMVGVVLFTRILFKLLG